MRVDIRLRLAACLAYLPATEACHVCHARTCGREQNPFGPKPKGGAIGDPGGRVVIGASNDNCRGIEVRQSS